MILSAYPLPKKLEEWILDWLSRSYPGKEARVERLAGDGSSRSFYRIIVPGASFVAVHDAGWTATQDYSHLRSFLDAKGLKVPQFFDEDAKAGCLMMEDLGDVLLQNRIEAHPAQRLPLLTRAAETLAWLHGKTFPVPANLPVSLRKFDQKKYGEELRFTLEHLHRQYLGLPEPSAQILTIVDKFCSDLASIGPEVFSHRDYHTRNIIYYKDDLYLIDFQDARLGPPHYDLASLIYDPYVQLSGAEQDHLIQKYKNALSAFPLFNQVHWETFSESLALIGYQRVVKAAGSFASFFTRFNKKSHLKYLAPALKTAIKIEKEVPSLHDQLGKSLALNQCLALIET